MFLRNNIGPSWRGKVLPPSAVSGLVQGRGKEENWKWQIQEGSLKQIMQRPLLPESNTNPARSKLYSNSTNPSSPFLLSSLHPSINWFYFLFTIIFVCGVWWNFRYKPVEALKTALEGTYAIIGDERCKVSPSPPLFCFVFFFFFCIKKNWYWTVIFVIVFVFAFYLDHCGTEAVLN